jgi:hypothetical protein
MLKSQKQKYLLMKQLEEMLSGGDLRSVGQSNVVVSKIKTQHDFDNLIELLFYADRLIVMAPGFNATA